MDLFFYIDLVLNFFTAHEVTVTVWAIRCGMTAKDMLQTLGRREQLQDCCSVHMCWGWVWPTAHRGQGHLHNPAGCADGLGCLELHPAHSCCCVLWSSMPADQIHVAHGCWHLPCSGCDKVPNAALLLTENAGQDNGRPCHRPQSHRAALPVRLVCCGPAGHFPSRLHRQGSGGAPAPGSRPQQPLGHSQQRGSPWSAAT